jgi:hypothetical protein
MSMLAAGARADTIQGTRFESHEVAHTVDVRVDRNLAVMVVRRTVANPGDRHDQSIIWIDTPVGSAATRLRSMGVRDGEHVWYEGELMEAEAAARKYKELTGVGGYYPKDPALLSWRHQGQLALQVFPVPPGGLKTVEYTFKLPSSWHDGRYTLDLPEMGTATRKAEATFTPSRAGDQVLIDGRAVQPGEHVTLNHSLHIELVPSAPARVSGGLASIKIARGRALMHTHVEAAPRLSSIPKGAHVVIAIDTSKSMHLDDVQAALSAASAYLSHFPDAKVEVLTYDRLPHAQLGGFVPVAQARAKLDTLQPVLRNGSHLDAAVAEANALFAKLPAGTPTRLVVVSDLRTRSRLTPELVKPIAARGGAVVHIATLTTGSDTLSRSDDSDWAPVARATGGLVWTATATTDASQAAERSRVYEEWARPLRLDHFKVESRELAAGTLQAPEVLNEGQGFEDLRIAPVETSAVDVSGELWSRKVSVVLPSDQEEAKSWSALVFGSELMNELNEKEMMVLAKRGGAVSPVTSYLAIEPGVRPSTEGLEESSVGTIGHGSGTGSGQGFGSGHGRLGSRRQFNFLGWLKTQIAQGWATCGGAARKATVELETTSQEVVDVPQVAIGQPADAKLESCLREVVWNLDLPADFNVHMMQSWTVELP